MDIITTLNEFICSELLDDAEPVAPDENLLADGMIDSLGMLRLVAFIEETFGYKVPPEHFVIDHFRNLNAIETYLSGALPADRVGGHGH